MNASSPVRTAPLRAALVTSLLFLPAWTAAVPRGPARASSHFVLRSEGNWRSQRLDREILAALEQRYRSYMILFETEPQTPIAIHLYPAEVFHASTGAPPWADAQFDAAGGGTIRVATGGVARLEAAFERTLAHELAHAFITTASGGKAPRWLHEGLAQHLSGSPQPDLEIIPEAAVPEDLSYPGCLAFVRHLARRHREAGIVDVLVALRRGEDLDGAFAAATGFETHEHYSRWRRKPPRRRAQRARD